MHQEATNIKIIKLENGDDIVCSLPIKDQLPDNHGLLRIEKPLQIKYIPQLTPQGFRDYIALVKWTAYTSDNIITIPKQKIMTITTASEEMKKSYVNICRDYNVVEKVPAKQELNYGRERLSDDDNQKINEIFEQFEDEDPTIH
jgi:hypothetical protein